VVPYSSSNPRDASRQLLPDTPEDSLRILAAALAGYSRASLVSQTASATPRAPSAKVLWRDAMAGLAESVSDIYLKAVLALAAPDGVANVLSLHGRCGR